MNQSERKAFGLIKSLGFRVVPQVQIGGYTVDFLLPNEKAIIEVDGEPYHTDSAARKRDTRRDGSLQKMGYLTIHIWTETLFKTPKVATKHILVRLYRERGIKSSVRGAARLYRKLGERRT